MWFLKSYHPSDVPRTYIEILKTRAGCNGIMACGLRKTRFHQRGIRRSREPDCGRWRINYRGDLTWRAGSGLLRKIHISALQRIS
ncbi:hypothetical protein AG1IA_09350 [Rhizoctonia solani AG-1 IA]|uniref:Uncharacterized protein n=1 Tax=Thanatephorus cucumeris (strain AG1-IA) TaxID=983506 RepID=L8WEJ3_THACA|nr:hypothetical protein AG1IA_09350 [Rhizoctonia solani AG-1 IA]